MPFNWLKQVKNTKKNKKFWITNMFEGGWIKGFWRILGKGNILIIYLDWHIFVLAYIWIGIYLDQRIFCQAKNVLGNFFAWQMLSIANFRLTKYSLVKIYANPIICQYKYMPIFGLAYIWTSEYFVRLKMF